MHVQVSPSFSVDPFEQQVDQWVLRDEKHVLMPRGKVLTLSIADGIEVALDPVW
jgi:hypothetical protein